MLLSYVLRCRYSILQSRRGICLKLRCVESILEMRRERGRLWCLEDVVSEGMVVMMVVVVIWSGIRTGKAPIDRT